MVPYVVGEVGLEPTRLAAHDPKSCSSASSDIPPGMPAAGIGADTTIVPGQPRLVRRFVGDDVPHPSGAGFPLTDQQSETSKRPVWGPRGTERALVKVMVTGRTLESSAEMEHYRVIAESAIHPGRRLLMNRRGEGFLQLESDSTPQPVPPADFARLRRMSHYQPIQTRLRRRKAAMAATPAPVAVV